jgi:hypothetical protein
MNEYWQDLPDLQRAMQKGRYRVRVVEATQATEGDGRRLVRFMGSEAELRQIMPPEIDADRHEWQHEQYGEGWYLYVRGDQWGWSI